MAGAADSRPYMVGETRADDIRPYGGDWGPLTRAKAEGRAGSARPGVSQYSNAGR